MDRIMLKMWESFSLVFRESFLLRAFSSWTNEVPQPSQKRASSSFSLPHFGQTCLRGEMEEPQYLQNVPPSVTSFPHLGQFIGYPLIINNCRLPNSISRWVYVHVFSSHSFYCQEKQKQTKKRAYETWNALFLFYILTSIILISI